MKMMVRLRAARCLAVLLAGIVAIPYLSCGAFAAQTKGNLSQTVVFFPLGKAAGVAKTSVVDELNTFLEESLTANNGYEVIVYSERLPAIQRLLAMQPEKKDITSGPFTPDAAGISRAAALGKTMSADLLVLGAVNQYVFDSNTSMAQVTVSVEVVDGVTGRSILPITVTGRADKPANGLSASEINIASEAVKDAGRKIVEEVTGKKTVEPVQKAEVNSKKKSSLPWLLLALVFGAVLGGGGGGSASSGDGDPDTNTPYIPFDR